MKKQKGIIGLLSVFIVVVIAVIAMIYLMNHNWFGNGVKVPSLSNESAPAAKNAGDINNQLDTLRTDVKNITNKKDQEIMDELNK